MPAILTQKYRSFLAQQVLQSLASESVAAYIFVGRVQQWVDASNVSVSDSTPPTPVDMVQNVDFEYWRDLLGIKKASSANAQFVIPRNDWTSGDIYDQYDDTDPNLLSKSFYVLDTIDLPNKVYKCLWNNGGGQSTVPPSAIGTALVPQGTSDGYVWQYMYTIDTTNARFLTNGWMPVLSDSTVQTNALTHAGMLPTAVPLVILDGGASYNASLSILVTLQGDGSGASITTGGVTIIGGAVNAITLATGGAGYSEVTSINVYQSGATLAQARIIIPPYPNHGYNPVMELGARAAMLTAQFEEDEMGQLTVQNSFRRVGLLINPLDANGNVCANDFYRQTTDIYISANTAAFSPDDAITNITKSSNPTAVVVDVITDGNTYVMRTTYVDDQGEASPFESGDVLKCVASGAEATVSVVDNPELTPFSGDIVFVNQRAPVMRGANQIEEVKIIFPFN